MLFHEFLNNRFKEIINLLVKKKIISGNFKNLIFSLEISQKPEFGDVSSNIAMICSRVFKIKPKKLAGLLTSELQKDQSIRKVEIVNPGFINIFFDNSFWHKQLKYLIDTNCNFKYNVKKKFFCVEFVSANPTGLIHIGHARGAVLGDSISSILNEVGHKVIREYYVNDTGEQITKLVKTILFHFDNLKNKTRKLMPDDLYPGDYLKNLSKVIFQSNSKNISSNIVLKKEVLDLIMQDIKKDLNKLKVNHDKFVSEKSISTKKNIEKLKDKLEKKKLIYFGFQEKPKNLKNDKWKPQKQLLFKSQQYGDDSDRALLKPNGELTYFMSDIIYHQKKIECNYDTLVNIWGADHSGYVSRLKNALKAINKKKYLFEIKLTALVNLLDKNKVLKMSKRSGNFVTLRDVINKVGSDVLRFMMISRSPEKKIDFDFDVVMQKTKDNPVFYIQYAYARCNSIMNISKKTFKNSFNFSKSNLDHLQLEEEKKLIKCLSNFQNVILNSSDNYEPHRLANYLYELSKVFHMYWGLGKQDESKRIFIENKKKLSESRLSLVYCVSLIIEKGLQILKIDCPKSM